MNFLILLKGKGTSELCNLDKGDKLEILGPVGNYWVKPNSAEKVAIFGGGVGVAPVAGFAST